MITPPPVPDKYTKFREQYLNKNYWIGLGDSVFIFYIVYDVVQDKHVIQTLPGIVVHVNYVARVASVETFDVCCHILFDGDVMTFSNAWWFPYGQVTSTD